MAGQLNPQYFGTTKIDIFSEIYSKILEKHNIMEDPLLDEKFENLEKGENSSINKMTFEIRNEWALLQEDGQEVEGMDWPNLF